MSDSFSTTPMKDVASGVTIIPMKLLYTMMAVSMKIKYVIGWIIVNHPMNWKIASNNVRCLEWVYVRSASSKHLITSMKIIRQLVMDHILNWRMTVISVTEKCRLCQGGPPALENKLRLVVMYQYGNGSAL